MKQGGKRRRNRVRTNKSSLNEESGQCVCLFICFFPLNEKKLFKFKQKRVAATRMHSEERKIFTVSNYVFQLTFLLGSGEV